MNDIHDLLGAYCTDALDADERATFERHLASCNDCRDEAVDFREVLASLADAHPVRPPVSLEDAVMAGVPAASSGWQSGNAQTPDGSGFPVSVNGSAAAPSAEPVSLRRRAAPWLAAAAAVVLFVGGVGLGRSLGTAPSAVLAGEMADVVAVASAPDSHVLPVEIMGTTSRVVMSGEMDKAVFLSSELPTLAKGMVYQVWLVAEDGQMTSAGSFTPDASGHLVAVLAGSAAAASKLMITMEPPGGSAHPSGEMLAEIETG